MNLVKMDMAEMEKRIMSGEVARWYAEKNMMRMRNENFNVNKFYGKHVSMIIVDDLITEGTVTNRWSSSNPQWQNFPRIKLNPIRRLLNMYTKREEIADLRATIKNLQEKHNDMQQRYQKLIDDQQKALNAIDLHKMRTLIEKEGVYYIRLQTHDNNEPLRFCIHERGIEIRYRTTEETPYDRVLGSYTEQSEAEAALAYLVKQAAE